jgi:hypothetical protein
MLGDLIYEGKGKTTGKRVLDPDEDGAPRLEISMMAEGMLRGNIESTDMWTYWTVRGQKGQGRGIIMAKDRSDDKVATAVSQGIGKVIESGITRYVGTNFYSTSSTGKLEFLNNLVGMFEAIIENSGNYSVKVWEWK